MNLRIEKGIFSNMVIQRTSRKTADINFTGSCEAIGRGTVEGRVGKKAWEMIGAVENSQAAGRFSNIPVGGPYEIEIRVRTGGKIKASTAFHNIFLAERLEHVSTVGSLDLEMKDPIHVGAKGLSKLGYRMGKAAARHFTAARKHSSSVGDCPTIQSARFAKDILGEYVEVTCRGVRGCLEAREEPSGFSLQGEFGWKLPIWKTVVEPSGNVVRLYFCNDNPVAERFFLYYGYGMTPHCNITDSEGLCVLGFGPYPVGVKPPYTKPSGRL